MGEIILTCPEAPLKRLGSANALEDLKKELKKLKPQVTIEKKKGSRAKAEHKEKVEKLKNEKWLIDHEIIQMHWDHEEQTDDAYNKLVKTTTKLKKQLIKLEVLSAKKDHKKTIQNLEKRNKQLEKALNNGLEVKPWKQCAVCFTEFKETGDKVPKILSEDIRFIISKFKHIFLECGHTYCWGCIKQLATSDYIQCPLDETIFIFTVEYDIDDVVKNFKALSM
ncbi:hypothetical protein CRE_09735 [Caenorhabditis remanei]|uniref:RING-type domain-containing protein n=1 Tax=Caenorhabditis remanei TaxID=31234 RepID=E3N4X3_CAERE|nr:hypothetical protein CRE_09735 [Caenorhabditis remanei]